MHSLKGAFLLLAVWVVYWPLTASQPHEKRVEDENENKTDGIQLSYVDTTSVIPEPFTNLNKLRQNILTSANIELKKIENSTEIFEVANIEPNSTISEFVVKSHSNLNPEQNTKDGIASNKIKPYLLFPNLPFLLPKENNESDLNVEENSPKKMNKLNEKPKPMFFLKFALKIRQVPLTSNISANSNDSKIINVKNLYSKSTPSNDLNSNSENEKRRRESKTEKEVNEFFDNFPLFPDTGIDELLPKPESLFSDLLFLQKPFSKLSQKKRDLKKQDPFNDDFKFFTEFFDKAFMKTKQELEETNPILDWLRGEETNQKEKNFWHTIGFDLKNSEKNPNLEDRIQGNLKPSGDNLQNGIIKSRKNPLIIVDNVIKIEKVHLHNDGPDKFKSKKKKKRETKKHHNIKGGSHSGLSDENRQYKRANLKSSKRNFEPVKEEKLKGMPKRKRSHSAKLKETGAMQLNVKSKEINVLLQDNTSAAMVGNGKTEADQKYSEFLNTTETIVDRAENLLKAVDTFENKVKKDITNEVISKRESEKSSTEKQLSKKPLYEDLEKNITKVLSQFLSWFKKLDDVKLEPNEPLESFDWTEKETLQNSNVFGKRSKKNTDFVEEYVSSEKKERQVADLNYLFLTVTLPTVIVSVILLVVCFLNFRIKGKICTKLFKPRSILLVEDENSGHSGSKKAKKVTITQEL